MRPPGRSLFRRIRPAGSPGHAQSAPCLVGGHERRPADGVPGLPYSHDQRKRLADLCITNDRLRSTGRGQNRSLTPGRGASESLMSSRRLPRAHPVGCGWRGVVLWYGRRLSRRVWRWDTWPGDGRVERGWGESPWGTVSVGASLSGSSLAGRSGTCRGSRTVRRGALVRRCWSTPIARRISRLLSGLRTARSARIRCSLPPRGVTQ